MHSLLPHGAHAAHPAVREVAAAVELAAPGTLRFRYRLTGELAELAVPPLATARRADRLFEHTCFEAFIAPAGGARYYELNFSPSTEWAAYAFDGYREGMRPLELAEPPAIAVARTADALSVTATVALGALAGTGWPWRIGLTAVVEERGGARMFYALRHPAAKPDFHAAAGFTVSLDEVAR